MVLRATLRLWEFKQHMQGHVIMSYYFPNYFSMFCTYVYLKFFLTLITFCLKNLYSSENQIAGQHH